PFQNPSPGPSPKRGGVKVRFFSPPRFGEGPGEGFWNSLLARRRPLADAPEVPERADEDLAVGHGDRGLRRCLERVTAKDLELRLRREDQCLTVAVGDVQPFAGVDETAPRARRQPLVPQQLAGVAFDATHRPRLVDNVNVIADDDAGADPLRGTRVPPESVCL